MGLAGAEPALPPPLRTVIFSCGGSSD